MPWDKKKSEYQKEWYRNHPGKSWEYRKRWKMKYPGRDYEQRQRLSLRSRYHLSSSEFENLIESQGRKCAICKQEFLKTPLVDHNHQINKVRGLVCRKCNFLLGLCHENPSILKNALVYLKRNGTKDPDCDIETEKE